MKAMKNIHKIGTLVLSLSMLLGCGNTREDNKSSIYESTKQENQYDGTLTAFYGDITQNRVVGIDIKNMAIVADIDTEGVKPYTIGRADGKNGTLNKLYTMTRKSPWIEKVDLTTHELLGKIDLAHTPRSCAYNEVMGVQLVSGVDKPMSSLIEPKSDMVVSSVGRKTLVSPSDFGGSNATGHPVWLNANTFALLDREVRKVDVYKVTKNGNTWTSTLVSSLDTPTSIHHFIGKGTDGMDGGISIGDTPTDTFYAVAEGSATDDIAPAILKLKLQNNTLSIVGSVSFDEEATRAAHQHGNHGHKPENEAEVTGGHHATMHPDGKHIYVGSSAGYLIVINKVKMKKIREIPTGEGSGHTTFVPQRNLAIVTNHNANFITIVDSKKHKKIKDLVVSGASINDVIMQSHTSFTDATGDFFYAFASNNGVFYEVDLSSLAVTRTLNTGGTPVQGCFTYLK
ncbi:MAG: hypothetical protein L3J43_03165 [Sulfurovum sp.]|nr:hypothetical protein [Sulfurovum sp.]